MDEERKGRLQGTAVVNKGRAAQFLLGQENGEEEPPPLIEIRYSFTIISHQFRAFDADGHELPVKPVQVRLGRAAGGPPPTEEVLGAYLYREFQLMKQHLPQKLREEMEQEESARAQAMARNGRPEMGENAAGG